MCVGWKERNFMKRLLVGLVILSVLALSALFSVAQSTPAKRTIIRAGKLVDVKSGKTLSNQAIVIEAGKIVSIGSDYDVKTVATDTVVDLPHATVLPGLVDV